MQSSGALLQEFDGLIVASNATSVSMLHCLEFVGIVDLGDLTDLVDLVVSLLDLLSKLALKFANQRPPGSIVAFDISLLRKATNVHLQDVQIDGLEMLRFFVTSLIRDDATRRYSSDWCVAKAA